MADESDKGQVTMSFIDAKNISKSFADTSTESGWLSVVDGFTLEIGKGELVTLFGPNGCGKTTILNLLAGTVEPDKGNIVWDSENMDTKDVGYVFQNYADTLLPWRTVKGNIAFALEVRGYSASIIKDKTQKRMKQFGLVEHAGKYVYELSGGLKQLVAIARATVYDPSLLLLDEPFSALDYSTSRRLWLRFRELWSALDVTTVFVSHNVDEAVFLGDRVCVMSPRPARVVEEICLHFDGERELGLLETEEFFKARTRVLKLFEEGRKT